MEKLGNFDFDLSGCGAARELELSAFAGFAELCFFFFFFLCPSCVCTYGVSTGVTDLYFNEFWVLCAAVRVNSENNGIT